MVNVLVLDGGQGTELERHGADLTIGDLWSSRLVLEDPGLIKKVHMDYLDAGSDVITTLTYQATLDGFERSGLGRDNAVDGLRQAISIAAKARKEYLHKAAARVAEREKAVQSVFGPFSRAMGANGADQVPQRWPLIAFSSGSYGGALADGSEFTGNYSESMTEQELADFHKARLEAVRDNPDVDILAFETVPCLKEAQAIAELLAQGKYNKLAWISFSCKDGQHTCHGEDFAGECIRALWNYKQVFAIGVNCTAPSHADKLLKATRAKLDQLAARSNCLAPHKLLLAYPNSGELFLGEERCWHRTAEDASEPQKFAAMAERWVEQYGVSLVGGCCRTTPEHIRSIHSVLYAKAHGV